MKKVLGIIVLSTMLMAGCAGDNKTIDKSDLPSYCTFASDTTNKSEINFCQFPNGNTCYTIESSTGSSINCNFVVTPIP